MMDAFIRFAIFRQCMKSLAGASIFGVLILVVCTVFEVSPFNSVHGTMLFALLLTFTFGSIAMSADSDPTAKKPEGKKEV